MKNNFKNNKYRSKRCKVDNYNFDSIKEAEYYKLLKLLLKNGDIEYFSCQDRIYITKTSWYEVDFIVKHIDGTKEYIDVKGYDTPVSKLKRRQVRDLHNIEVKLI